MTVTVTLAVPHRWSTRSDPASGLVLHARAPMTPPSGFAPEIVVRTTPVAGDLARWRAESLAALAGQLDGLDVEDTDRLDLDGRAVVYHRIGHRLRHRLGTLEVVAEQWSWLVDGVGVTLTGSVARADYADYADVFEEVAATLVPGVSAPPGPGPGSGRPGAGRS
ncbi:hypothetical protein [Pimelobacter simplex]|uniref:hypothetical protein n=1 Tax=Nocardioides simplex TaxID=2045 RepID=UPI00214FD39E|nr:hypothetical protein [Pimelobacter simplex]UUW90257.1 hypothetical protein M0M43_01870 [Pimelobacter simplex]UUW94086.1 hypothetical protein M0M48_20380 [Pimelobacter simplex]